MREVESEAKESTFRRSRGVGASLEWWRELLSLNPHPERRRVRHPENSLRAEVRRSAGIKASATGVDNWAVV